MTSPSVNKNCSYFPFLGTVVCIPASNIAKEIMFRNFVSNFIYNLNLQINCDSISILYHYKTYIRTRFPSTNTVKVCLQVNIKTITKLNVKQKYPFDIIIVILKQQIFKYQCYGGIRGCQILRSLYLLFKSLCGICLHQGFHCFYCLFVYIWWGLVIIDPYQQGCSPVYIIY